MLLIKYMSSFVYLCPWKYLTCVKHFDAHMTWILWKKSFSTRVRKNFKHQGSKELWKLENLATTGLKALKYFSKSINDFEKE